MTDTSVSRNISGYWQRVTPEDLIAGKEAYPAYLEMMKRISAHYGTGLVPTTEAFVALSPNSDYYGNLRSLVSVIHGMQTGRDFTISTYKACGVRALSYLDGSVSFLDTVKGKKISAFRHNILYQNKSDRFVLDGHMIAIAAGRPLTMKEANLALRQLGHDRLDRLYKRFSRKVDLPVHVMQATLWHCRKRSENIKFSTQKDLWRDDNHLYYDIEEIPPYPRKAA